MADNPGPGVGDGDLAVPGGGRHGHGDRRARGRVLQGIADQVVDDLAEPPGVGADDDGRRREHGQRPAGLDGAGTARRLHRDAGQVHRLKVQRAVLVELGEEQQVVDQPAHPGCLGLDAGHQPGHLGAVAASPACK